MTGAELRRVRTVSEQPSVKARSSMYVAVETHYLGPTDHRGARIVAHWGDSRLTIPYPYPVGPGGATHALAAGRSVREYFAGVLSEVSLVGAATRDGYAWIVERAA